MNNPRITPEQAERIVSDLVFDLLPRVSNLTVALLEAHKHQKPRDLEEMERLQGYLKAAHEKAALCRKEAEAAEAEIARIAGLFGWKMPI